MEIDDKIADVIVSCNTNEQLTCSIKYIDLAYKRKLIDFEIKLIFMVAVRKMRRLINKPT